MVHKCHDENRSWLIITQNNMVLVIINKKQTKQAVIEHKIT